MPFAKEIGCLLRDTPECLDPVVERLRRDISTAQEALDAIEAETAMLEGADAVITSSGDLGGWYASVSTVYDNPRNKAGVRIARCSAARDVGGPDDSLPLARLRNGQIEHMPIDPARRDALGFNAADVQAGLAACPWPI